MIYKPHVIDPVQRLCNIQTCIEFYHPEMHRWSFAIRYEQLHNPNWTVHRVEESRG